MNAKLASLVTSTRGRAGGVVQQIYLEGRGFVTAAHCNIEPIAERERLVKRLCNAWNALRLLSDDEIARLAERPLHPSYAAQRGVEEDTNDPD